jgi:hypothetical protein
VYDIPSFCIGMCSYDVTTLNAAGSGMSMSVHWHIFVSYMHVTRIPYSTTENDIPKGEITEASYYS